MPALSFGRKCADDSRSAKGAPNLGPKKDPCLDLKKESADAITRSEHRGRSAQTLRANTASAAEATGESFWAAASNLLAAKRHLVCRLQGTLSNGRWPKMLPAHCERRLLPLSPGLPWSSRP